MKNQILIIEVQEARRLIWAQLLSHLASFHYSVQCLFAHHSWMTDWSPIVIRLERNADIDYRVKKCKGKKTGWEDKQILVPLASCVDSGYCFIPLLDQNMQNNMKEKHGSFLVHVRCLNSLARQFESMVLERRLFFSGEIEILRREHFEIPLIIKRSECKLGRFEVIIFLTPLSNREKKRNYSVSFKVWKV